MEEPNTTEEVLALGACIGRTQALNLIANRCSAAAAETLRDIREALPGTGPDLGGILSTPGHQPWLRRSDPRLARRTRPLLLQIEQLHPDFRRGIPQDRERGDRRRPDLRR